MKTLEGSDTESFEEVSESDLQELAAHKSALSNGSDTLTSVSLTSLQSKPEADESVEDNGEECVLLQMSSVHLSPDSQKMYFIGHPSQ
jgi:hypothetical protein